MREDHASILEASAWQAANDLIRTGAQRDFHLQTAQARAEQAIRRLIGRARDGFVVQIQWGNSELVNHQNKHHQPSLQDASGQSITRNGSRDSGATRNLRV